MGRCSLRSGLWKIKDSVEESLERTSFFKNYYSCICSANLEYISVWLIYKISLSQQGVAEYLTRLGELYSVGKLRKMSQMEAEESLKEYLFQDYLLWQAFWFSVPSVEGQPRSAVNRSHAWGDLVRGFCPLHRMCSHTCSACPHRVSIDKNLETFCGGKSQVGEERLQDNVKQLDLCYAVGKKKKPHRLLEAAFSKNALASQLAHTVTKSRLKTWQCCLHLCLMIRKDKCQEAWAIARSYHLAYCRSNIGRYKNLDHYVTSPRHIQV